MISRPVCRPPGNLRIYKNRTHQLLLEKKPAKAEHRPTNVHWSGLILWLTFPECWRSTPLWADPAIAVYALDLPPGTRTEPFDTHVNARRAVDMLFRLLDEFLEAREPHQGLSKIFRDDAL